MRLAEIIERLEELDEDDVVCMKRPWSDLAECKVVALDENMAVPASIKAQGFDYFLELHVCKEVIGVIQGKGGTPAEKIDLLLFYATNDAYPDWVYSS
jgi:hypothetical protein